jgi:hypothetical protein
VECEVIKYNKGFTHVEAQVKLAQEVDKLELVVALDYIEMNQPNPVIDGCNHSVALAPVTVDGHLLPFPCPSLFLVLPQVKAGLVQVQNLFALLYEFQDLVNKLNLLFGDVFVFSFGAINEMGASEFYSVLFVVSCEGRWRECRHLKLLLKELSSFFH